MPGVMADTHAVVWYLLGSPRLSSSALAAMDDAISAGEPVYVSALSLVEIVYLAERGRLPELVLERIESTFARPDGPFVVVAVDLSVARATRRIPRAEVPEMPDRVIAATALRIGVPLITRDHKIQAAAITTVW